MRRYLLASSIVAFSAPAFAETAIDPEVQKHFDLGNQLYAEGRYDDALVEYDKAYALSNNWKILYNRGQTLVMLRRDPQAINAFEQYLARGGADVPEERRAAVEQDLTKLRQRLAWITLSNAPAGADVLVDGHPVDKTPLKKPVAVGAGKHVIALEKSNKIVFSKDLLIAAGDTQNVAVVIAPEPKKEAPVPPKDDGGLPVHAFTIALSLGVAAPMAQVARGRLALLGNVELAGGWRIHPLWSVGAFIGGASGQIELKSSVSTLEDIDPTGRYGFGIGGVRGRLHLLRDRYFDGWIGLDLGVWRETWSFNPAPGSSKSGFEWASTSPAVGIAAGLDFPIARTWALGAAARVFGTAVRSGDRFGCGAGDNRCDSDDLPGGGGLGGRGFFEFVARLTWSIPYGGR